MTHNNTLTLFYGVAMFVMGSVACINVLADDALPASMPPVMRNALIWGQGDGVHMVDLKLVKSLNLNVVNVAAVPHGVGTWIGSLKPLPAFKMGMRNGWKADVDELNKAGIAVWTSFSSTSFEPEVFQEFGLDPERYYARNEKGEPQQHFAGGYSKEGKVFSSCPNNPNWMAIERDTTLLAAENGFAGLFYDVGILADDADMFCHCDYCKAKWKQHLTAAQLDPETPLPVPESGKDMTNAVNRDHLRWRYACIEEDWMPVHNAVKAKYPTFVLGPNSSDKVSDYTAAATIMGHSELYDFLDFEEWSHGAAPYSTACSYLLGRAAGNGKPVLVIWNNGPFQSAAQLKIAFAEASATGGVCQSAHPGGLGSAGEKASPEIRREYNDFVQRHEDYFRDFTSMANVGIVYSQWSREFYEGPQKRHACWWFGQMLLDMHVPFDYLVAERDVTPKSLGRYKALILPDIGCLSNDQISALTAYTKGGGAIYATHETGKYDEDLHPRTPWAIETLGEHVATEAFRKEVGRGRVAFDPGLPEKVYWEKNPRDLDIEKQLTFPAPPSADLKDALDWVFQKNLPIEIEAKSSTMVTIHRQKERLLVHLVNYNTYPDGKELTPDRNIAMRIHMPPESDVATVKAISPDAKEDRTLNGWKMENGILSMTLDKLESYTVIVVDLTTSSPKKS